MADREAGIAVTPETRFCIASLAKPMTSMAVVRLVEQRKLALSDPVATWIDGFPEGNRITVEHLVTHTAGVPHRVTTPEEEVFPTTAGEMVERVKARGLLFEPGTSRQYSSAGYSVLARIIERVTGQDYGEAMRTLVFGPLGMNDTFHASHREIVPHRAAPYLPGPGRFVNAPFKDYSFLVGAGSLVSTAEDVYRFARAVQEEQLLTRAGWEIYHGLGWARGEEVQWSGSTNGFGSGLDIHRGRGEILVFTGNLGNGALFELRRGLGAILSGQEAPPPRRVPEPVSASAADLEDVEGSYGKGSTVELEVRMDSGTIEVNGAYVIPTGKDHFFNPAYYNDMEFVRSPDGTVSEVKILMGDLGSRSYERIQP